MSASKATVFILLIFLNFGSASLGSAQTTDLRSVSVPWVVRLTATVPEWDRGISSTERITFAIYDQADGGTQLWSETQYVVVDAKGRYSALLGSTSPSGLPTNLFSENGPRWLEVCIEGKSVGKRTMFVSVPYALKASDSDSVGGYRATELVTTQLLNSILRDTRSLQVSIPTSHTATLQSSTTIVNGSQGYLARFQDPTTLVNSALYETNGNIGVGVTNPEKNVDVAGSLRLRSPSSSTFSATSPGLLLFSGSDDYKVGFDSVGGTRGYIRHNIDMADRIHGHVFSAGKAGQQTDLAIIRGDGNVGIGTSDPDARMTVDGVVHLLGKPNSYFNSNSPGISLFAGNSDYKIGFDSVGGTRGYIRHNVDASDSLHGHMFSAGPTGTPSDLLLIRGDGNIGVGTSAPSDKVEILGTLRIDGVGNGVRYPDGSLQTSAAIQRSLSASDGSIAINESGTSTALSIADSGVRTAHLQDGAVTLNKLASDVLLGVVGLNATNTFSAPQLVNINAASDSALKAQNTSASGNAYALRGETSSSSGVAVSGYASSSTGPAIALHGRSDSNSGIGIFGEASQNSGQTYGVYGLSRSANGTAVYGEAVSSSGTTYGVYGTTASDNSSAGVYGSATKNSTSSTNYGVYGTSVSAYGVGVFGYATNTSAGTPIGVLGRTDSTTGVAGQFTNSAASGNILVGIGPSGKVWRVDVSGQQYLAGTTHTGGADYAEAVAVSGSVAMYEAGDVVVIDDATDRHVSLSREAYSTHVLGVYSTKPGLIGSTHSPDGMKENEIPVAMIGIVPTKASTENGPIRRGDLLVSSSMPGHVMKATDRSRALGAIVGKAMQNLESGTGVIEIAVTLQ